MKWMTTAVLILCAGSASAGSIHYTFTAAVFPTNTYTVSVQVAGADTSGLAAFHMNFGGFGGQTSLVNFTPVPLQTYDTTGTDRGFSPLIERVFGTDNNSHLHISASQIRRPGPVFDIGMAPQFVEALTHPDLPPGILSDLQFGVPAVLGTLTLPASTPWWILQSSGQIELAGALFTTARDPALILDPTANGTQVTFSFVSPDQVPEPASLVLAGLGLLGGVVATRRRLVSSSSAIHQGDL